MANNEIFELLRNHRHEIRRHQVKQLSVFGSVARDEAGAGSDIDILVEFSRPVGLFEFVRLKAFLEDLLGCDVDLVTPEALRPEMRDEILQEAVHAA